MLVAKDTTMDDELKMVQGLKHMNITHQMLKTLKSFNTMIIWHFIMFMFEGDAEMDKNKTSDTNTNRQKSR